jgi:enamine deaminase RidA (YjgF/YER057c/UK114 family)
MMRGRKTEGQTMAGRIEARLAALGIELPEAREPVVAKIRGALIAGPFLFVSGQVPQWNGDIRYIGKVGREFSIEEGQAAARLCALNVLAHARAALGDLDRVVRVAKLKGYVNAMPDVAEVNAVVNGASELMVEVFGEAGQHVRTVAGVTCMPFNVALEVEADFLIG